MFSNLLKEIYDNLERKDERELDREIDALYHSSNMAGVIQAVRGLVHGGINAVLAETAASLGANENLASGQVAVGVNITTQHLRKASSGTLSAKAIPVHIGTKLQTWEVRIYNAKQLTSLSTVTLTNISQN